MVYTILILLVLALVLSGVLWAGTLWFQGWLYNEPAGALYWRAPAVGAGLTLFYAVWVILDCRTGGYVRPLHQINSYTTQPHETFKAVVTKKGSEVAFKHADKTNPRDFRVLEADGQMGNQKYPERPEKIIIEDGGTATVFEPQRDAKGNFKTEPGQNLYYFDKSGRYIDESSPGVVTQFRLDWLILNLVFNALHLGLWFAGLWLLLRYQWSHALGLAAALWLAMTLFPVPMLLDFAEQTFHVVH